MTDKVLLEHSAGIAHIIINNPPVNALGADVRRGIRDTLEAALSNDHVKAILVSARGRTFPAGADISEFGKPAEGPGLSELCDFIESAHKPVMAAMHGMALGGGLELAMACHYRVAREDTQLGLPEVTLGLIPGAGGTQRTPRLIGAEAALEMMLSGLPISAGEAEELGLIDAIAGDDLSDVMALMAEETPSPRPTRDQRKHLKSASDYMAQVSAWRNEVQGSFAREKIVDCVEAALLLPFEAGIGMERDAFEECLNSPVSKGMRHAFFAERRAAKFAEVRTSKPRKVEAVGIVGGGLMGSGITTLCLDAGLKVTLLENGESGVTQALDRIGTHYQREAASGRISETQGTDALSHLSLTADPSGLAHADLVVECLPEDAALKHEVLGKIIPGLKPDAVLASNTSYLDVGALARGLGRPADTLAMHFFAPAARMRLVEIGVTDDCVPDVVATAFTLAKSLGKIPVRCAAMPGLIGNRMLTAYREACDRLLLEGASPNQVDTAMRQMGMPLGPYEMLDRSGLNIAYARRMAERAPVALALLDRMCEAGWLGRKAGRGYYVYDQDSASGTVNQEMMRLLSDERDARNVTPRNVTATELRERVMLAMANAGATLIEQGVATRPSDIDTVMLHGFGFPRERGGPMYEADVMGTFEVARRITRLSEADPEGWSLSPILKRLASERLPFASLNRV